MTRIDPTHGAKIATCCYCGTRAALVLAGEERHELACSSCGAPLHDLKLMPLRGDAAGAAPTRPDIARPSKPRPAPAPRPDAQIRKSKKPKRRKKRKTLGRWLVEEAFDAIEDIFD